MSVKPWIIATLLVMGGFCIVDPATAQVTRPQPFAGKERIETMKGKSILVITPHPDDDTITSAGILAMLAKNGNKIHIVVLTNDGAGSDDPTMTKEKLEAIRKKEEENACAIIGIGKENLTWLGYDDGMLEYADAKKVTMELCREIRKHRPDIVFAVDPGAPYRQYHKSDHRAAAILSVDAMRAAGWRLYFPELEKERLKYWETPTCMFYYSADPNYEVDITDLADLKAKCNAAHTSQWGGYVAKYNPNPPKEELDALANELKSMGERNDDGKFVERFRWATGYGK